ncbi:MAG: NAD(P)-dependent oxidoreductase [Thermoleophilia bacterium]|nr:NAD(P)-dependent oxidoreductase [Thermoleophilia bacterium]
MSESKSSLGFIGLGAMGGRMARNLLQAGYPLVGFDTDPVRLDGCAKDGAQRAASARDVAERCDSVLTSLPSSDVTVQVYEESLLPAARAGQIFIDHGITRATDTRRLAERCWDRGAELIDAPVSGSLADAEGGVLRIMTGGAEPTVARCRPIFEVIGDPEKITHCGPSGQGQVMKGVQQLCEGLVDAALMEAIAYGVRGGLEVSTIVRALRSTGGRFAEIARSVLEGKTAAMDLHYGEWAYYLDEAGERGFPMPMLEAAYEFYRHSPYVGRDGQGRGHPSFWAELLKQSGSVPKEQMSLYEEVDAEP